MSLKLKEVLFNEYDGFADKRIKNLEKGSSFIVDDRDPHEANSSGNFNAAVPFIFATVGENEDIKLDMMNNVPHNETVRELVESRGGTVKESYDGPLSVKFKARDFEFLHDLSEAIQAITRRGAPRYSVASWKYSVPRVVGALDRLADVLENFARRHPTNTARPRLL